MAGHFLNRLRAAFDAHADRPALLYRGQTYTFARLDAMARAAAGWLEQLGVEPGDRVALVTGDKLPFLVAHLGALYAGAAPLPLNPRYTREELRYFLGDSEARVVVVDGATQVLVEAVAGELEQKPVVVRDTVALDPPAATFVERTTGPDDLALLLYSSGTTGWPKGVVHTQANVDVALAALGDCWRMRGDDVVYNALPLFHIHGLAFATHLTWLAGGCVLIEDTFESRAFLTAVERATVVMAVPTMYYRLLDEPAFHEGAKHWPRVRLFTCGSAPIRAEVLPGLEAILGRPLINRYGMTEAYVITSLPLDGPWPSGSVGLPLPGVELRVVGDGGQLLPPAETGSVVIRGSSLFREYWRKPEATQAALVDGWFDTGDLGTLDAAGYLTLVGRKHDLIITAGFNVYPQVVERVIGECPGVRECAVLGVPDADRGERVAVAIVRADSSVNETTIAVWCTDRLIHYQRPKAVLFVEALPRNSLGKVLRRELQKLILRSG